MDAETRKLLEDARATSDGLARLIEARFLGVSPEDQFVILEDGDWRTILAALSALAPDREGVEAVTVETDIGPVQPGKAAAEWAKLVRYFRGEGYSRFGYDGDVCGQSPAETAILAMKALDKRLKDSTHYGQPDRVEVPVTAEVIKRAAQAIDDHPSNDVNAWARAALEAVLRRPAEASTQGWQVPEGWKLVPVKPTEAMEEAHFVTHACAETVFASVPAIWAAMLAAAPLPPSPAQPQDPDKTTSLTSKCESLMQSDKGEVDGG